MAPADEADPQEEEDGLRFVEDDDDAGPKAWQVDTPAVFLDADWHMAGDILGELSPSEISAASLSCDLTIVAYVMRQPEESEIRIISCSASDASLWTLAAGAKVRFATGSSCAKPPDAEEAADATVPPEVESQGSEVVGVTSIDDGQWHHVALVFKDGVAQLFVDGQPEGEDRVEVPEAESSGSVVLGQEGVGDAESPHSRDLQVFYTALSENQIRGMMSSSKDLGTGLTLAMLPEQVDEYWRLKAEGEEGSHRDLLQQSVAADPLERPFQQEVLLDLFDDLMNYAKTICLTSRKTSVIVQIVKELLDMMHRKSETTGEISSIYECFKEFKRMIVAHSHAAFATAQKSDKVPQGNPLMARLGVFRSGDVRLLTDFVVGALFQQFRLYQCVLIVHKDSVVSYVEVEMQQPLPPQDLRKAVSKKMAAKAIAGTAKRNAKAKARSKETNHGVPEEADEEVEGVSLDQTLSQLPKDLTIDEHHEESTKAAEATAKTSILRHDKDLSQPGS